MSQRDARHFYQIFDNFWKGTIIIIAYLVPLYGITWERIFFFLILLKDSHHDRKIMSRHDAEDEFKWK